MCREDPHQYSVWECFELAHKCDGVRGWRLDGSSARLEEILIDMTGGRHCLNSAVGGHGVLDLALSQRQAELIAAIDQWERIYQAPVPISTFTPAELESTHRQLTEAIHQHYEASRDIFRTFPREKVGTLIPDLALGVQKGIGSRFSLTSSKHLHHPPMIAKDITREDFFGDSGFYHPAGGQAHRLYQQSRSTVMNSDHSTPSNVTGEIFGQFVDLWIITPPATSMATGCRW